MRRHPDNSSATAPAPDGPLSDDDHTGTRILYPDPNDTVNIGGISGRVVPANPFAFATLAAPVPGSFVTGIFEAHVVAVDSDTGAVIAGTLEPLVGLAVPADFSIALGELCASGGSPVCTTPPVDTNFNPRILPASA